MTTQLPDCITASRNGLGQSEYDEFGELAPVSWKCNCGSWITLEHFDGETEKYVATSESARAEFLAKHTSCVAKCFKCRIVPVDGWGYWCDECSDKEDARF